MASSCPRCGSCFCVCAESMVPRPALNMIGFTYSSRSPAALSQPYEMAKPATTGSPNLLP